MTAPGGETQAEGEVMNEELRAMGERVGRQFVNSSYPHNTILKAVGFAKRRVAGSGGAISPQGLLASITADITLSPTPLNNILMAEGAHRPKELGPDFMDGFCFGVLAEWGTGTAEVGGEG